MPRAACRRCGIHTEVGPNGKCDSCTGRSTYTNRCARCGEFRELGYNGKCADCKGKPRSENPNECCVQ